MEDRLRKQIEFYFSDSNLSKDAYLKGIIAESEEGWVPLSKFLSFNKIKAITTEEGDIRAALERSQFLVMNEDKSCVRRTQPYVEKEIPPSHFIYVEHLSPRWDHDFVRALFSQVGEVLHVSLPRDKKSKLFRGFGFVEFATEEDAKHALQLNGHREPSWISELTVMLKTEWMDRKKEIRQLHTVKRPTPEPTPHLLLSNVPKDATSKQLRNLLTMVGPVVYLELWGGEKRRHSLVRETTSIVRFQTPLATERCLYLLEKHRQFMIPGKALEARKLTEEEEEEYEQERGKRDAPAAERSDKRRRTSSREEE